MALSPPVSLHLPWRRAAFVADRYVPEATDLPTENRRDIEQTDDTTFNEVMQAIEGLGLEPVAVDSPGALAGMAEDLRDAVVLSTYGGDRSRNRLLLTPAVAESLNLDYVGMDAVGQALAANKMEAKRLARECGVLTPLSRLIRDQGQLNLCDDFPLPYVLKPVAEGTSIGIGARNLIRDRTFGQPLAAELLERFEQPVLIEAFVGGREASLVCIEGPAQTWSAFVEIVVEGQPRFFDDHLFEAEEKVNRSLPRSVRLVTEALAGEDRTAIERLLNAVGHYGYCRIDGKFLDGRFNFLELTPDAWLGASGQLAVGFTSQGWTYQQVIGALLQSALLRRRDRSANG